ncbi:MAG: hypothetical protein MUC41_09755 [Syntrophobacteraceae bacterium]|jgi:hypothetical protein|nr:hypothetical protein [Syntrophobacteraceae bacterium]
MQAGTLIKTLRLWPLLALLAFAGCASTASRVDAPSVKIVEPVFPPHEVMESQLYSAFLVKNQEALLQCSEEARCAVSLFNLGFVYLYPRSPYYNHQKGIYYFKTLIEQYPHHSFASLAKIWTDLINRCIAAENLKVQLTGKLKSREVTIKELQKKVEEKTEQVEEKREEYRLEQLEQKTESMESSKDVEAQIDRVEKEILKKLDQSRAIDVEIERKERELVR